VSRPRPCGVGGGGGRFYYALGCGDEYAALLRREGEWEIINVG